MMHNEEVITPNEKILLESSTSKSVSRKMCNVAIVCHDENSVEKRGDGKISLYACPAKGCPRNVESPRQQFFPNLYTLKMHYLTVHGEKKYQCSSCQRRFGNEVVFRHHKEKCKQQCHDCECGRSYTSRNALLTHARRKQHKIVGDDGDKKSKGASGVITVPGILYLKNTECLTNLKITNPVKCQTNLKNSHPVKSNMIPQPKPTLPRLLRILPKASQSVSSVIQCEKPVMERNKPVIQHEKPVIQLEEPVISQEKHVILESEEGKAVLPEKPVIFSQEKNKILQENPILITENLDKLQENSIDLETKVGIKDQESLPIPLDASSTENVLSISQQRGCYKRQLISSTSVPCTHGDTTYHKSGESLNGVTGGKRKVRVSKLTRLHKPSKLVGDTFKERGITSTKCRDVFNEISTSAKKLADMCTQTLLTFNDIEESPSPKKVNINTQTQVNDFHESLVRTTMDTHTQINYHNCKDVVKKSTMDTHTQIDSCNFAKFPETLNIDTQTQINSYNFNEILKKMTMDTQTEINTYDFNLPLKSTMDTQTEINTYDFNLPLKSTMESMDTQTEINSYNFNDICIRSSVETMDSQTEINYYDFNDSIMEGMGTQTEINSFNFDDISIQANAGSQKHKQVNVNETPKRHRDVQTCINQCSTDDFFHLSDNETQTERINPWLSDFTYQSTMGTQTNFSDNYLQTNFGIDEPLVLDKSIQLDDMISLDETRDIILTESSNISTQTVERENDVWLHESLLCESSSTQTDYFENLDFMDIDFHIDGNKNFGGNTMRCRKDSLISGNIVCEQKSHMETQTTIPLYDMLDSPLNDNYMDKNIANIETQTTDLLPDMFYRPTSSIETQTDCF